MSAGVFYLAAFLAILFASATVFCRKSLHNLVCFLCFSVTIFLLFLILKCSSIASVYLLVYAGALLILFLFAVVLTRYQDSVLDLFGYKTPGHFSFGYTIGFVAITFFLLLGLWITIGKSAACRTTIYGNISSAFSNISYTVCIDYALALSLAGLLILTAVLSLSNLRNKDLS